MDHEAYRELLVLDADGDLPPLERSKLERHLEQCRSCRDESREQLALGRMLVESRVPVAEGFAARVLDDLPHAGWESRHRRSWSVAALVLLTFSLAAGALSLVAAGDGGGPVAAAASAVFGLLQASTLAASDLLDASWRGVGTALSAWLGLGTWNRILFGVVVLGIDIGLLLALRRRWTGSRVAEDEHRS